MGTNTHVYTLHCTLKQEAGNVVPKNFCRKLEIFYPGFLHEETKSCTDPLSNVIISDTTTGGQQEDIQRRVQKYHNDNAMSGRKVHWTVIGCINAMIIQIIKIQIHTIIQKNISQH